MMENQEVPRQRPQRQSAGERATVASRTRTIRDDSVSTVDRQNISSTENTRPARDYSDSRPPRDYSDTRPARDSATVRPTRNPSEPRPARNTAGSSASVTSETRARRKVVDDSLLVTDGEARTVRRESEFTPKTPKNNRSFKQVQQSKQVKQKKPKNKVRGIDYSKSSPNTHVLNKGFGMRFVVVPCVLMLLFSIAMLVWHNIHNNNVEGQVAYIKSYMTASGTINDWQGKLQCKGIGDIHWYRTGDTVEIDFGNIIMTWDYSQFITQTNLELIKQIGFEVYYTKDKKDIRLFWGGKEVERWIK